MLQRLLILVLIVLLAACAVQPAGEFIPFYQVETLKPYAEVLAELEVAIAEQNFRVTGHSRVGKVIRERGATGFPEYDTIQFCNLTHAKTILLMSPAAIRFMPCNIVLYQQGAKTIIRTHLIPTDTENAEMDRFSAKMNDSLKQIVDFAVAQ